jgi:transcriptional regulator with XRE-family HTH domain
VNYGHRISVLREERQLTQEELAGRIGITRSALSHYENNRRAPDYDTLLHIANYFEVRLDDLLGIGNDEEPPSQPVKEAAVVGMRIFGYHIVHTKYSIIPGRLI